jgi:Pyridoxamine 5'-phosphate oxidase
MSLRRCRLSSDVEPYGPSTQVAPANAWNMDGCGCDVPPGFTSGTRLLGGAEAMELLASVDYGRVVFWLESVPAIRPVNHLVDEGRIIIRTWLTSAISGAVQCAGNVVVAYEADRIDPQTRSGWSVVVTGHASSLTEPGQVLRYQQLLKPWINEPDTVVAIEPEIITGLCIIAPLL